MLRVGRLEMEQHAKSDAKGTVTTNGEALEPLYLTIQVKATGHNRLNPSASQFLESEDYRWEAERKIAIKPLLSLWVKDRQSRRVKMNHDDD